MLLRTEAVQEKHKILDPRKEEKNRVNDVIRDMTKFADTLYSESVSDPDKRRGNMMSTAQLEAIITKLMPDWDIKFLDHPHKPELRVMWVKDHTGDYRFTTVYRNTNYTKALIPEFSIIPEVYEWVPDESIDVITPDMVKELGPWAGFKRVRVPAIPEVKGWRDVFICLINDKMLRLDAVERKVGGSERQNWNAKTKGNVEALF